MQILSNEADLNALRTCVHNWLESSRR